MESPPSTSTWSEPFILSDDSGLLLTSGSSGSMSGESRSYGRFAMELQDSDCEDKSLSQADSLDGMSDIMCGENFNTLKKGPHWIELSECKHATPIEPPPEFQDKPNIMLYESLADKLLSKIISEGIRIYCKTVVKCMELSSTNSPVHYAAHQAPSYWTSEFLPFGSPPSSRRSLVSSRLSSSHNSLSVPSAHKVDDSSFITQAVSHDTLVSGQISDIYNVPFDSDVYAVPVDVIRQPSRPKRNQQHKKRRRNTSSCCHELDDRIKQARQSGVRKYYINYVKCNQFIESTDGIAKRHSVAGSSAHVEGEPIHMTLQEVRHYLQTLYSSSSDSSVHKDKDFKGKDAIIVTNNNNKYSTDNKILLSSNTKNGRYNLHSTPKFKKSTFLINITNKRVKDTCESINKEQISITKSNKPKKSTARMSSLKQTLCNIFRFRRFISPDRKKPTEDEDYGENIVVVDKEARKTITNRALPPLPPKKDNEERQLEKDSEEQVLEKEDEEQGLDFSTSIQKVKDYGWYWGPLSSEAAEKILSNEPDGSFIVRDSSDDHYIFSLTFKLNNSVRHVRIEHDQGKNNNDKFVHVEQGPHKKNCNFSFGSCTKFKSQTIVEFIENAVEHSRSGRYLFFLHRRPANGPVRVQLLHPVSRFKQIQSLQHMCRFVILKLVRRDLLPALPLPRRMIDYLNTPHYYSEHLFDVVEEQEETCSNNNNNLVSLYDGTQNTCNEVATVNNVITSVPGNNVYVPNPELGSPMFANNVRQS